MEILSHAIQQLITVSATELNSFLGMCMIKKLKRYEVVSRPGSIPNEIFFINKGLIRVIITDNEGVEHSIHFAIENQFYS